MRKLVILTLVLGLASVANAALVLSIDGDTDTKEITLDPSDSVVIDIYNTDGEIYLSYLDIGWMTEGLYSLSNPHLTALAGDLAKVVGPYEVPAYDIHEVEVTLAQGEGLSTPGSQFEITLHCEGEGDVYVCLFVDPDYVNPADALVIHQTPEPMTIALLGLGGLFLRRRK